MMDATSNGWRLYETRPGIDNVLVGPNDRAICPGCFATGLERTGSVYECRRCSESAVEHTRCNPQWQLKGRTGRGAAYTGEVLVHEAVIPIGPSLAVRQHSSGFGWGCEGPGPAQLALAVLLVLAPSPVAAASHRQFEREIVATLQGTFSITLEIVLRWLEDRR